MGQMKKGLARNLSDPFVGPTALSLPGCLHCRAPPRIEIQQAPQRIGNLTSIYAQPMMAIRMKALLPLALLALPALLSTESRAVDDCRAVHSRSSSPGEFTRFVHLNDDSTIKPSPDNFLRPTGAVCYGAAFKDGIFYGIEFAGGLYRLVTIPLVSLHNRVQIGLVGFPAVEALACVEGQLIAANLDTSPPHHTDFISIDSTTGIGTLIGEGSLDVMIVGLAYDPVADVLYGVGMPYATVSGYNLYTINPATGATSLVGNIGHPVQSLTVSPSLGLVGAMGNLISIDPDNGAGTVIGSTDYTLGMGVGPTIYNGLYALASPPPSAAPADFLIFSITRTPGGVVNLEWTSETGYDFQVKHGTSLSAGAFSPVSGILPGTAGTMTFMHSPGAPTGFYVVEKTLTP